MPPPSWPRCKRQEAEGKKREKVLTNIMIPLRARFEQSHSLLVKGFSYFDTVLSISISTSVALPARLTRRLKGKVFRYVLLATSPPRIHRECNSTIHPASADSGPGALDIWDGLQVVVNRHFWLGTRIFH